MTKIFLTFILAVCVSGCNSPNELPLVENEKPADIFARHFFDNLIGGQTDDCLKSLYLQSHNDQWKATIASASKDLGGETIKNYKLVQNTANFTLAPQAPSTSNYALAYEFELSHKRILFWTQIFEQNGIYYMVAFGGKHLNQPLAEQNKFILKGKSFDQYLHLILAMIVPIFLLFSLLNALFSNMSVGKKALWAFIIALGAVGRFTIDWNTGQAALQLLTINLLGAGCLKTSLISGWVIYFSIPIGAIAFWANREDLIRNNHPTLSTEAMLLD